MKIQPHGSFSAGSANTSLFVTIFFAVFLLVVITATLVTFIQPETFQGTARVRIPIEESALTNNYDPVQIEIETLRSQLVLGPVVQSLNLNSVWGKRYAGGQPLQTRESLELLRKSLRIVPLRRAMIIEVQAFSVQPEEAAMMANAVAESYVAFRSKSTSETGTAQNANERPLIIDRAIPNPEPVRPKKALNITLGCVFGIVLGAGAGVLVVAIRMAFPKKRPVIG